MDTDKGLRLRVWDASEHGPADVPLAVGPDSSCMVALRCLSGASGIQVVLSDADAIRLRAELDAIPGEVLHLQVKMDGDTSHVSSQGNILSLPPDGRYDAPPPIEPDATAAIDIAIVIDGTLRAWDGNDDETKKRPRLLEREHAWRSEVEKLTALVGGIVEGHDWQAAVLAFGDQDPPAVTAADLRPSYVLHPAGNGLALRPQSLEALRETLAMLPATPGADFVDALADALAACNRLRWRNHSRRILILCGDSPGFSLLNPLPKEADLCVREHDVDTQALLLHRNGVEISTIYYAPPREKIGAQGEVVNAARRQYAGLASVRELAFDATAFDSATAAERIRTLSGPIGRGASLGVLADPVQVRMTTETVAAKTAAQDGGEAARAHPPGRTPAPTSSANRAGLPSTGRRRGR